MQKKLQDKVFIFFVYLIVILFAAFCLFPLLMAFMVSITEESIVSRFGYSLFPKAFSINGYRYVAANLGMSVINGYKITLFVTVAGTLLSMLVTSTLAYVGSTKSFRFRNILNLIAYIPMVFTSGLLPWYIVFTRYYHLSNNVWGLILPFTVNLFFYYLLRNFFSAVPQELAESGRIDGASHFRIYANIYMPVARVGVITVSLFYALQYWNDFYLALMFIRKTELYPLQYYLYNLLSTANFIANNSNPSVGEHIKVPLETVKMVLTCVTIGPIILVYPLSQKYFVKGIVVGAVKG